MALYSPRILSSICSRSLQPMAAHSIRILNRHLSVFKFMPPKPCVLLRVLKRVKHLSTAKDFRPANSRSTAATVDHGKVLQNEIIIFLSGHHEGRHKTDFMTAGNIFIYPASYLVKVANFSIFLKKRLEYPSCVQNFESYYRESISCRFEAKGKFKG